MIDSEGSALERYAAHLAAVNALVAALPEPARLLVEKYRRVIELHGRHHTGRELDAVEQFVADLADAVGAER